MIKLTQEGGSIYINPAHICAVKKLENVWRSDINMWKTPKGSMVIYGPKGTNLYGNCAVVQETPERVVELIRLERAR